MVRHRWRAAQRGALLVAAAVFAGFAAAQAGHRPGAPGPAGFSNQGLTRVDSALAANVDSGRVPGAVLCVWKDGRVAFERAVGWADRDSSWRMGTDALFRIASQTKAVTSVAVLILADEGKLSLDDEVSKYLPAFAKTTVATPTDTGLAMVEAEDEITIKELLTHTSGISYGMDSLLAPLYAARGLGPSAGPGWYTGDKDESSCSTVERLNGLPFSAQPGTRFVYGYSSDVLGCIVEKVSGVSLDEFIRKKITNPLRMRDTYFFVPVEKAKRLATVYQGGPDGKAMRAPDGPMGQGSFVTGPRKNFSGGAGLVTTARDYARFLQMLMNRGEIEGTRIVSKKMVDQMTKNQVGDLYNPEGIGFGFGVETIDRAGALGAFPEGTWGLRGGYGTRYIVVPSENLIIVLMAQLLPKGSEFRDVIPDLVYRALHGDGGSR